MFRKLLPLLLVCFAVFFFLQLFIQPPVKRVTLEQFRKDVHAGQVQKVTVDASYNEAKVTYDNNTQKVLGLGGQADVTAVKDILKDEHKSDLYNATPVSRGGLGSFLITVLPVVLFLGVFIFFMRRAGNANSLVGQIGRSGAARVDADKPKVTFKEVAGADEAVQELREVVDFLKSPEKYKGLGARIPRGVMLYGQPGTGKTLLARAVAGEAEVPFFHISGSAFVQMYVGVGASRVRDLFKEARMHSPSIIFVDEIDAVGRHRGSGVGGGNDEREQTLNQLLVELDGFDGESGVIVIAATNRPDSLDPALLRPGRFDRQVRVDPPDRLGRVDVLKVHTKGKPLNVDVKLERIAAQTPGFSGADLANIVNEAALLAARESSKTIRMKHLEEGIMRVIVGPEKQNRPLSEREKRVTAVHEMGHALLAHHLEDADPPHKISIIGRGMALGYVVSLPTEDRFMQRKPELMAHLAQALGGRVAEEMIFNEATTGAENDLQKVTEMARRMVTVWGLSSLGLRTYTGSHHEWSERDAQKIDDEVMSIIAEAREMAQKVLTERQEELERFSEVLMKYETIDADQFARMLAGEVAENIFKVEEPVVVPESKKTKDITTTPLLPPVLAPKPKPESN